MDIKQEHEERAKEGLWGEIPFRNVSKKDLILYDNHYISFTIEHKLSRTDKRGRDSETQRPN